MRIGFFSDSYLPAVHGVEISMEAFRTNLEKIGHEVFVYAPRSPGYKDKNPKVFRLESVRVVKEPEMRLAFPLAHEGKLKDIVNFKLDVAHAHTPFSLGLLGKFIATRQKIPFIYTHHTHYPEYAKAYFKEEFIIPKIAKAWSAWFCEMADAVIAPSHKIENLLRGYGVKKPIYILPTGIDLKFFKKTGKSRKSARSLRKKLGLSGKDKLLIFVGRIGREKNIEFLVKAAAAVSKKRKDVKFLIVGAGPYLQKYETAAKKLGLDNVTFTGAVPHKNLPFYYQAADLFIFASLTETQGIVILEAMASGLPVIALKDDAFKGIVADEKNGFLVDAESSPKFFIDKALEILDDGALHGKFSRASLKIAANFSEEKQAEKLAGIYKNSFKSNGRFFARPLGGPRGKGGE